MSRLRLKAPVISHQPPRQPPAGGIRSPYRIKGIWRADGALLQPERVVIVLSDDRETSEVGDIIYMDRSEAAVIGKRHALEPLTFDEAAE